MDKQPKLIDAEKLLKWMTTNPEAEGFWNDENVVGVNMAYESLKSAIDNGSFAPDPIPPTIKQGDRVFNSYYDEGTVKVYDLYGDGRALVEFDDPECGERLVERNKLEVIPNG